MQAYVLRCHVPCSRWGAYVSGMTGQHVCIPLEKAGKRAVPAQACQVSSGPSVRAKLQTCVSPPLVCSDGRVER